MPRYDALVALHYQNENCHPEGKIKVGIAQDAEWRNARLSNAKRLFEVARTHDVAIVHVRLAVRPDYRDVIVNTPIFRQWLELEAWQEGAWGTEFYAGLAPIGEELVVTHCRNSGFHGSRLQECLFKLGARRLICCGVSTAYAVESTVRQATDIGYEVTVAADACSTGSEARHQAALDGMAMLAEICTVADLIDEFRGEPG